MSHKKLRPFIVKVSVLCYFPLGDKYIAIYVKLMEQNNEYLSKNLLKLKIILFNNQYY